MTIIEFGNKLDFNNVLIRPKRSTLESRSEVSLEREFKFKHSTKTWKGVPVISANMDSTGTLGVFECLRQHKILTALNKFYDVSDLKNIDESFKTMCMISTGISDSDYTKLVNILNNVDCDWICIDIANGYMNKLVDFCKKVRENFPDKIIVAGNVVSKEMVEELLINGKVDIVKVGIGPGSACTTRMKTGVGMPQLSSVMECADAAHGVGGHIISDGGITCPGDMAKAFGGGADFVMMGGQFAGHDQNPGDVIMDGEKAYKTFYGMSSHKAQEMHYGKINNYRSSEGRVLKIPYKGDLNDTVNDYLGGLRSTCTYIGASTIKQVPKCTTFVCVSQQLNTVFV